MIEKMGVRQKRAYTRKRAEDRRIAVSISLANELLADFRKALAMNLGREPNVAEIRSAANNLAIHAVNEFSANFKTGPKIP